VNDIESQVFTRIATELRAQFQGIDVTGMYVPKPASLPSVSVVEMDNSTYLDGMDSSLAEKFTNVAYEVNAYSDKASGRKAECKRIIDVVSTEFRNMGFVRTFSSPIPNPADPGIYRISARYTAVVDEQNRIFRR
jgi:hypothetical protein